MIMRVFSDFSPEVEALSLDEAFLDMTGSEQLFGDPQSIGHRLKDAVRGATGGLTASVLSIIGRVAGPLIPICGVMMRGTLAQTARVNERRLFGWVPV
jgi:hypothetical protein